MKQWSSFNIQFPSRASAGSSTRMSSKGSQENSLPFWRGEDKAAKEGEADPAAQYLSILQNRKLQGCKELNRRKRR